MMYETDKSLAEEKELAFYYSFMQKPDMQVLEPMCGNGRMLIPLLKKGVAIDGFDLSEEMLEMCRAKCRELQLEPHIFRARLEEFTSDKAYDLVMIPIGSFSLIPDEWVKRCLENMRDVLKEEGKILLTVVTNDGSVDEIPDWEETNRVCTGEHELVEYRKVDFDPQSRLLHTKLKYHLMKDGRVEKEEVMDFPVRLYDEGEFESVLASNGFPDFIRHEVADGYGKDHSFQVFELRR